MRSERGFSLLELMVALAIFATLAAAVMTAQRYVLAQSLRLEEKLLAGWVLDNHLARLRLEPALQPGQRQVEVRWADRAWQVFEVREAASEPGLVKVELAVRIAGQPAALHSLTSRVPAAHE
jgi:general secretion pathway protein I